MAISFKRFTAKPGFTPDFERVHQFLVRLNQPEVVNEGFLWGRWEWMFSLRYLDAASLPRIGIWEEARKGYEVTAKEMFPGRGRVWKHLCSFIQ